MWIALRVLIASALVWYSGVSAGKLPSIKDCKQGKGGMIDCRNMGFQNVPYNLFSIPGVKIYLSKNPYICDCSFAWFLREPSSNMKRIEDFKDMKCASPYKGYPVKGLMRGSTLCKNEKFKLMYHCKPAFGVMLTSWHCLDKERIPERIPYDVYTAGFAFVALEGEFICDCATVWFIRRLNTPSGANRFADHKKILCKPDKAKGITKPVPVYSIKEEKVCPQKKRDHCKADPCPAKVTTCKKTRESYECIDVNECSKKTSPCESPEVCVNKIKTGYECKCPKELLRDKNTKKCVPPDPCKSEKNPCPSTSRCETIRLASRTSHRCVDIDECLTGNYTCAKGEECYNKENGYECRCMPGLTREKDKCIVKIDPCKAKPPVCDLKTQRCVSKNSDSYECQDIDECTTQQHECHKYAKCVNTDSGYICQCKPGFKEYDNGRQCKDLNECSDKYSCAKHAKCINLPGSYKCECKAGYFGNGKYCSDQNECKGHSKCSVDAVCKNKLGTYQCICKKGYHGNGHICKDINECSQNKFECPRHSKCRNIPGSYTCKCISGFKMKNGRCLDVDECKINSHNCDKNALCINFVGSYKCRCKKGFEHLKDGRLCLKEEVTSEEENSLLLVFVAVPTCLLLVIFISCCLFWQRRTKKRKENSESEEAQRLLESQLAQDGQQQPVFMFEPRANREANAMMFGQYSAEQNYDDMNNFTKID